MQGHQALERDYVSREIVEEPALGDEHVAEACQVERLEGTNPAVQNSKGIPRGGPPEIVPLEQQRTQPKPGRLMGNGNAVHTATDHDEVVSDGSSRVWIARDHTDHRILQSWNTTSAQST
jgi:hypothetical protein